MIESVDIVCLLGFNASSVVHLIVLLSTREAFARCAVGKGPGDGSTLLTNLPRFRCPLRSFQRCVLVRWIFTDLFLCVEPAIIALNAALYLVFSSRYAKGANR